MDESDSPRKHWSHETPALSALAAFEAIARLGSFKGAAKELNRTPSAVSHAIRDIERAFGTELFFRVGRRVALTPVGEIYLKDIERAIDALKRSNGTLKLSIDDPMIRISAPPLIVATLLIPQINAFESASNPYKLKIETTSEVVSLESGEVDVGVRFVSDVEKHLYSSPLPRVWGAPVASPDYLREKNIRDSQHLLRGDLIQVIQSRDSWRRFFAQIGIALPKRQKFIEFDSTVSALEAARQGLGIMMGIFPLVEAYPGYGTELTKVPSELLEYPFAYQFVCRASVAEQPKIRACKEWLDQSLIQMTTRYGCS